MATNSSTVTAASVTVTLLQEVSGFLYAIRLEFFLFCAAAVAYRLLFADARPQAASSKPTKGKALREKEKDKEKDHEAEDDDAEAEGSARALLRRAPLTASECDQVERDFQAAFEAGDHREVLRCWASVKLFTRTPEVSLVRAVESMQRFRKDAAYIVRELRTFFSKFPACAELNVVNDLLESLGRRLDSELVEKIVEMMPTIQLRPDQRTYEALLNMYFMMRNFHEVRQLASEMQTRKVSLTTKAAIVVLKTALKTNNFAEATRQFRALKATWEKQGTEASSPSTAPQHIVAQLVELACKDHQLPVFLPLLVGVPLTDEAVCTMLTECVRQRDLELTRNVERLVRRQGSPLSEAAYAGLVRAYSSDPVRVQDLHEEVITKGVEPSAELALALLGFCSSTNSVSLAERLFEHMKPKQLPVLTAFIRFYADGEHFDQACDVYEQHVLRLQSGDGASSKLLLDARLERSLLNAALRCGRQHLAQTFLEASPADIAKHIAMIRSCATSGNLQGAMNVFNTLHKSGVELNSVVYNTVLDACVECRDLKEAEAWMARMKEGGFADVVSYNTLIKAHLQNENFKKARSLMEQMRAEGLQPNRVTYNELVNGLVARGSTSQRPEVWEVMEEMQAVGVKPNQVTCSILLKNLNARSSETDIVKTMELINAVEEPMDEVLLSSVVEACVRIGKPDLLASKLKQLQGADGGSCSAVSGSHTFGSLIKAYGHAKDMDSVWRCWKEMRSRHIRPTSITLGCMVEAVVSNGDTEGAFDLIHQMQEDERCRDALNSVIYCSVLKGFAREKKLQRVWSVYREMLDRQVDLSVVTYNTLIDACARCGRMERVPELVEDMKAKGVRPNLITYSTMLKGHCQLGDIQTGFTILQQMKRDTDLKPDEIMYNSLLDGCAQNSLVTEGMALLDQMQEEGVLPSNFTLSLLVKLMSRARKLDGAFTVVEEMSRKHGLRPNVHVYTNLIQACVNNRQLKKAMETFEVMLGERIQPESRTYALLVRGSLACGLHEQAASLLRGALGLEGSLPLQARFKALATCPNLDYTYLGEALQSVADSSVPLAAGLLTDIKQYLPRVRIDPAVQRRIMASGQEQDMYASWAVPSQQAQQSPQYRRNRGGPVGGRSGRQ